MRQLLRFLGQFLRLDDPVARLACGEAGMTEKRAITLITGASAGIGVALARTFAFCEWSDTTPGGPRFYDLLRCFGSFGKP